MSLENKKVYMKDYNKKYYAEHKAKYHDLLTKKVHCDICDCDVSKVNYSKHVKTTKHLLRENKKQNQDLDEKIKAVVSRMMQDIKGI
jgi:hypothetical protein